MGRSPGILTIDFEDYRRQELRDHRRGDEPPHSGEVERQLAELLEGLESIDARATFFSVGRLVHELPARVWGEIRSRHRIGCHGYEHLRVARMGKQAFAADLRKAKGILEDATGESVVSFRAPYFAAHGCDPWFGETLADAGFLIDSSRRLRTTPDTFRGEYWLPGSAGAVREIPLPSIGFGSKRITVIGGSYFRLLPLLTIMQLLAWGEARGFIPMIYLHPYDLDPDAPPLEYEPFRQWIPRLGDWIRRQGRRTTLEKLRALASIYDFQPIECVLDCSHTVKNRASSPRIEAPALESIFAAQPHP